MAGAEWAREPPALGGLPRAETTDSKAETELSEPSSLTPSTGTRLDQSPHPLTIFVTVTISPFSLLQDPTSLPISSQSLRVSTTTSVESSSTAPSVKPSSSSYLWHPTQVGTVLSETGVPYEWGPKDLETDKRRAQIFVSCISLIFVFTLMIIIGEGCWRTFWRGSWLDRKLRERQDRKRNEREDERLRERQAAMELEVDERILEGLVVRPKRHVHEVRGKAR